MANLCKNMLKTGSSFKKLLDFLYYCLSKIASPYFLIIVRFYCTILHPSIIWFNTYHLKIKCANFSKTLIY